MITEKQQKAQATLEDPRWSRVLARDAGFAGEFVYSVKTTGVYCRPDCPSRRARPENVSFHDSPAAAERAGFRPCKRCRPDQLSPTDRQRETIEALCRLIEAAEQIPTLAQLAAKAGISSYHLHRLFKQWTGLTPRTYAKALRARRVRQALGDADSVTEAFHRAGYNSSGRFYAESNQLLGMMPDRYRCAGARTRVQYAVTECFLGAVLVAQTELGICAVLLGDAA